jgi:hypothetical protein
MIQVIYQVELIIVPAALDDLTKVNRPRVIQPRNRRPAMLVLAVERPLARCDRVGCSGVRVSASCQRRPVSQ